MGPDASGFDRIRFAVLKLSRGDLERLRRGRGAASRVRLKPSVRPPASYCPLPRFAASWPAAIAARSDECPRYSASSVATLAEFGNSSPPSAIPIP